MKHFFFIVTALCLCTLLYGQSTERTDFIPPSPNASSLGQYIDIPVSRYTGVPDISIPLMSLKNKDLEHTISASYHASGIKVAQEASLIGLGWSIQMGGLISRTIRGKDDLRGDGYVYTEGLLDKRSPGNNWAINDNETNYFFSGVVNSGVDTEPDFFFYNFGPYSGKLLIKNCKGCTEFEGIPEKPNGLKFSYNNTTKVWKVQDGNGVGYTFEQLEYTVNFTTTTNGPLPNDFDPIGTRRYTGDDEYISGWYLTSITSPKGNTITFKYKSYGYKSQTVPTRSHDIQKKLSVGGSLQDIHTYAVSAQMINDVYLEEIDFENGKVKLITGDRLDILPYTVRNYDPQEPAYKPQRLARLEVYYGNNTSADKTILFDNNNYFGSNNSQNPQLYYRLKLDQIRIRGKGGAEMPPYRFTYTTPTTVPPKNSFSIDHWGYFNNAPNHNVANSYFSSDRKTLIPTTQFMYNGAIVTARGANRKSNETYAKLFILNSITFPTGGTHAFEYELNTFSNPPADHSINDENPGNVQVTQRLTTSNVFMDRCPYDDEATGSGTKTLEFEIKGITTIASFKGEATNECVSCGVDQGGLTYYYIGDPDNPSDHVGMNLASKDGMRMAKLERINGPGGSVSSLVKNITFYYEEPGITDSDQHHAIMESCAQGEFLYASQRYEDITMGSGWYRLTVYPVEGMETDAMLTYYEEGESQPVDPWKKGAGLRVKQITMSDGEELQVKTYSYSGGELMSVPTYSSKISTRDLYWIALEGSGGDCNDVDLLLASENSLIPLGNSAAGSFVGYSLVTEYNGANKSEINGSTQYSYYNRSEETIHEPLAPGVSGAYHLDNGLLNQIIHADSSGNIARRIYYDYQLDEETQQKVTGAKIFSVKGLACPKVAIAYYDLNIEWWKLIKERTVDYIATGERPEKIIEYTAYNPHNKLVEVKELKTSDGKQIKTIFHYPVSSAFDGNQNLGNQLLKGKHMNNVVLRTISLINNQPVFKAETLYATNNGNVVPVEEYTFPKGTSEKITETYKHSSRGNMIEIRRDQGHPTAYLWGYNDQYPVAKVVGSDYTTIAAFIDNSVLQNPSSDQVLRTELNKIRTNLAGTTAQVTTYTYIPLVGVSTITDPRGEKTTYTYDTFSRLEFIRDETDKLLEEYKYHYKN